MSLGPGRYAPALLAALLNVLAPRAHGARPTEPASPADPAASRSVLAARAAFDRGDYAGAIVHFEAAMALRPAPKLHYNLGVCHMRLYRQAGERADSAAESRHAAAAIEALNTYLRARPDADDRGEVEDMVRALGGNPVTQAQLRDPMRPIADTPDPAPTPPAPTVIPPTPAPTSPLPNAAPRTDLPAPRTDLPALPRGYLGLLLGVAVQPQLAARSELGGLTGVAVLRGGGRLGARRRIELGGHLAATFPGDATTTRPNLTTTVLAVDLGYAVPLGRARRLELPIGGFVGLAREALRVAPGQPRPPCAIQDDGTLVGARAGGVLGGRLGFAVLVGARRHHELGMHLTLAFHGFGPGPSAPACDAPGRVLQDVPRARLMLTGALGYAYRF